MNHGTRDSSRGNEPEGGVVVRLLVPDQAALDGLLASGVDLCGSTEAAADGITVHACLTPEEMAALQQRGYVIQDILWTGAQWRERIGQRDEEIARERSLAASVDELSLLQACCCRLDLQLFLHVVVMTSAGALPNVILTASWDRGDGTEMGSGGVVPLIRITEAGEYLHHRMVLPVSVHPVKLKVTSSLQGSVLSEVARSPDGSIPSDAGRHYVTDFSGHYLDPGELNDRMESLASQFPTLAEVIDLPHTTTGYQRRAQTVMGSAPEAALVITSQAAGHEGGNHLSVRLIDPRTPDHPLTLSVAGGQIDIRLATDGGGRPVSTTAQVSALLNSQIGDLVSADPFRGSTGNSVMAAQPESMLTDHLKGPPEVARGAFRVRALRIGKHRDGTRPGVMVYAQEHAREWVTPLVAIETAERLVRNYGHDVETAQLVDALEIFIIPCVNPDGAHYSFHDYGMQRKNMVHPTEGPHREHLSPELRHFWGADLNRNHAVGSVYDGYAGASTNCLSQVYAGPERLSEAESRNLVWLAEQHPTIKFAMNLHSYGGYVMWVPGAYRTEEHITLERPSPQEEAVFRMAADRMVAAIKGSRGTTILPNHIGAGVDVLYSAAGNSTDQLWYERGIFAWEFEVGAALTDPDSGSSRPVGFQPPFAEARAEALEFADGLMALFTFVKERGSWPRGESDFHRSHC